MKKFLTAVTAALLVPLALAAQEAVKITPEEEAVKEAEEKAQTLYTLGYLMGNSVKSQLIIENEQEFKYISQGMRDSLTGKSSQTDIEKYKPAVIKRYEDNTKQINEKRIADQKKFLASAKKERNTKEIDNGILVQTITKGKGDSPSAKSTVKVNYHGTLIDGTVFDSSVLRGEPVEFGLDKVISCWTKGLQEAKAGGKVKLICPPETAYGNRGAGQIQPNSVLIFEIDLLEVK